MSLTLIKSSSKVLLGLLLATAVRLLIPQSALGNVPTEEKTPSYLFMKIVMADALSATYEDNPFRGLRRDIESWELPHREILANLEENLSDNEINNELKDLYCDSIISNWKNGQHKTITCKELVFASLCKVSEILKETKKAEVYCNLYLDEYELSIDKNFNESNEGSLYFRCTFGYTTHFLGSRNTLQACKNGYDLLESGDTYSKVDLVSLIFAINYIYRELDEYENAINYINNKLPHVGSKLSGMESTLMEIIGDTYLESNQYLEAVESYQQVANLLGDKFETEQDFVRRTKLALALLHSGQHEKSERELLEVIDLQEAYGTGGGGSKILSQNLRIHSRSNVYTVLTNLYIEKGEYEKALKITDRGRSAVFAQQLINLNKLPDEYEFDYQDIQNEAKKQGATIIEYATNTVSFPRLNWREEDEIFIWVVSSDGEINFQRISSEIDINSPSHREPRIGDKGETEIENSPTYISSDNWFRVSKIVTVPGN